MLYDSMVSIGKKAQELGTKDPKQIAARMKEEVASAIPSGLEMESCVGEEA